MGEEQAWRGADWLTEGPFVEMEPKPCRSVWPCAPSLIAKLGMGWSERQVCAQAEGYQGHGLSLEPKAPPGTIQVPPGTIQFLPGTAWLLASQPQLTLACFPVPGSWGPHILWLRGEAAHIYIPGPARKQVKG